MAPDRVRYRFGPLERRGLIAGWRGGQVASVASGLVVAVLALRSHPTVASVVVALVSVVGGVALACWPVAGRTGEEWLPTVARWGWCGAAGRHRHRSGGPGRGHCTGPDGAPCGPGSRADRDGAGASAPSVADCSPAGGTTAGRRGSARTAGRGGPPGWPVLGDLALLSVAAGPGAAGQPCGVVRDRRARTYTAALAVGGHSFALLGPAEQERRVAGWASVLASLARERSVVHRVQWIASALPDDGRSVLAYLADRAVLPGGSPARQSYEGLLAGAGASTCRHEAIVAVQVRAGGPAARAVRAAGGGDAGAGAVLLRELATLRRLLGDADVLVDRALGPRELAATLRRAWEAGPPPSGEAGERPGPPCAVGWPWPMAVDTAWGWVRTDGTWHATYWIAEWPRVDVGPDFLGPLLLGSVRRSVSVVMEPFSPSRAVRQAEQARTADLADAELRRRGGFLSTARRSREEAVAVRREEELADGHASFRFSGYVTVTAPSREELVAACEATEQVAGQCRLELRRLYGDQERALTCTLPLCRGLA